MSTFDVDQAIRDLETTGKPPDWVSEHLRLYRDSGGTEGHLIDSHEPGSLGPVTSLLLTTIGRHSGEKRTSPLFYGTAGGAYVIIASKGGADTYPGWYLNLRANPVVDVQVKTEQFTARARVAAGTEREHLWAQMVQMHPPYGLAQKKTTREFPVVVLEKQPTAK